MCYSAAVVCPMSAAPIPDGAVLVEGARVTAVGPAARLRPHASRHHHVGGVVLPGFVDARTCLERTDVAVADTRSYPAWQQATAAVVAGWDDARVGRSAQRGVHAALRAGTTCVGDVVQRGPGVPAASRAGLLGDSWIEIDGVDVTTHDEVLAALERSLGLPAPGRRVGVSVPGTAAVGTGVLQALVALTTRQQAPLHIVVAASRQEARAVTQGAGPLAQQARVGGLQHEWLEHGSGLSPVRYLEGCGALEPRTTLGHVTKARRGEYEIIADAGVPVVVCPGADALVGVPRLAELAAAGADIALGSDPGDDVDMLAAAGVWRAQALSQDLEHWPTPDGSRPVDEAAVRLVTIDGARAMGWSGDAGCIEAGRRADLVGVDLDTEPGRVYTDLLSSGPGRQVLTVVAGVRRARRNDADVPWPEHALREESGEEENG